jgi:xanthine dehydrogenase accessory factor
MTCHSGGTVDIYLEPVLPPSRFLVFGSSPVARALSRMAGAMGFVVDVADPGADRAAFPEADRLWTDLGSVGSRTGSFAVVATMGERDEEAVRAAIAAEPAYLGVVASGKRFAQIRESLVAAGVPPGPLERIKSPAGLDIGARTPEEIAVSILAEIVNLRREQEKKEPAGARELPGARAPEQRDPVCGMTVAVTPRAIRAEIGDRAYYFCCGGCREKFVAAPERFVAAGGAA